MATLSDKHYDLAIVDPPYGIGIGIVDPVGGRKEKYKDGKEWDKNIPQNKYFIELKRISDRQIIWGANYFNSFLGFGGAIVWDKDQPLPDSSQCEIASCSYYTKVGIYKQRWTNFVNTKQTKHPTEKPIALYKWLLQNYAKPGWTIFDSHVGSGSLRIACHDLGFDFEGCEIDKDYWEAQESRYQNHIKQNELFEKEDIQKLVYQEVLL